MSVALVCPGGERFNFAFFGRGGYQRTGLQQSSVAVGCGRTCWRLANTLIP